MELVTIEAVFTSMVKGECFVPTSHVSGRVSAHGCAGWAVQGGPLGAVEKDALRGAQVDTLWSLTSRGHSPADLTLKDTTVKKKKKKKDSTVCIKRNKNNHSLLKKYAVPVSTGFLCQEGRRKAIKSREAAAKF